MYFKVFLDITVAAFAVFGLYSLVKLLNVTFFGYDNIRVTVEIDSLDSAENIDEYLKEARADRCVFGGRETAVIIRREYSSEKLLLKLKRKKIRYFII